MNKRLIKQIIYGSGYSAVIFFILFAVYLIWIKPESTCFDNKQNQGETGVDCGGPCAACEIRALSPIKYNWIKPFPVNNKAVIVSEIKNQNLTYAADYFSYIFDVYDKNGNKIKTISRNSFIYANEIKYLVEPTEIDYSKIKEIKISFLNINWKLSENFPKPKIQIKGREIKIGDDGKSVEASGFMVNDNPYSLKKARIIGVLNTLNNIKIGVSKTEFDDIGAFEETYFKIIFPQSVSLLSSVATTTSVLDIIAADPNRTEIYVEAIR